MDDNAIIPEKRRKLKVSHILIVLLLIAIGGFVLYRWQLRSKLQARIDAIRAAGYPVTCAELDDWYSIPKDAENAAYVILDAAPYYRDANEAERKLMPIVGKAEFPPRTEPLSEEAKKLIEQYLIDNKQALELLHKAAAIEHSRYLIDLGEGMDVVLPYLSGIRRSVQLLNLEAVLHAENGKPQSAARSAASSFGITRSLAKEPIIVSQLVRVACQALSILVLERAINRTELTDEQLVELGQSITDAEDNSAIAHAFAGERCAVLSVFRDPTSLNPEFFDGDELFGVDIPPAPVLELYKALGLLDKGAIIYLDLMAGYIEVTQLPEQQRQGAAEMLDAKFESISGIHVLLHEFMPAFSRVITVDLKVTAQLRTAQAGLAIERYRLAAGKLPDEIADLVPNYLDAVPKDPFDGEDLRYKRLEMGFVVYSIGEDGSDDGGKERPPRSKRKEDPNWDVTFIVER